MTIGLKSLSSNMSATDAAAAWFARRRLGRWSEADALEFAAWLRADAANTAAWASFERLWGQVETVRDDPKILAIRERARQSASRRQTLRHFLRVSGALAASLVVAAVIWWSVRHGIAPLDHQASNLRADTSAVPTPTLVRDISTDIGERSLLVLADGSKVTLNTASAVHADYTGRERRLTLLRGEAFFDVAKDANRPFIVFAGSREVVAVGTAFDIRVQDRRLKITLVEGKVRIAPASDLTVAGSSPIRPVSAITLEPGSALIAQEGDADQIERLDVARVTSWRTGKLVFDGERLAEVVAEMNRYSRQKLQIVDPALEERRVSGVFEPAEGPAFAKALELYGIARATRQTTTTIALDSPR